MKIFRYKKTFALILLLLLSGAGVYIWRIASDNTPVYREAKVTRDDIEVTILATGVVQPRNRLEIKPPIPGRVEEMLVKEGQGVHKGQVIAWMSSSERAALLDAARAKGPDELKRWEELYRATPVIAPLDGMIILRNAEPGQTFQNQEAILVMSDRLVVRASVDETDIAQVRVNQRARITLDAYPAEIITGSVGQVAFDAKTVNNVTTYQVDVLPERVPAFMRSGMTANVVFVLSTHKHLIVVPLEAVRDEGEKAHVVVQTDTGPTERVIELGVTDGRRAQVLAGLQEGDTVLVQSLKKLGKSNNGSNPFVPSRRVRR